MEFLLREIEQALDAGLYFIALQSSLTLPDICAALISPNGRTNREKYIKWYDTYAKEASSFAISGTDCYCFRCSCVHQGSTQHSDSSYSRIVFIAPNSYIMGHNNIINGALNIDINVFCRNIISSVRKWVSQVKDNPIFTANYPNLLQWYPNGFFPYIVGVPVIT